MRASRKIVLTLGFNVFILPRDVDPANVPTAEIPSVSDEVGRVLPEPQVINDMAKARTRIEARQLATQLQVAGGDLYLPADVSYVEWARDEGLVRGSIPVARLTAGIIWKSVAGIFGAVEFVHVPEFDRRPSRAAR